MSVQNIRGEHTQKMFVNFEGEVEQFETLGFQPRMLDFHNQSHQMQMIDKYILNNSGKGGFISFW